MLVKLNGSIIAGPAEGVSGGFASASFNDVLLFQPAGEQGLAFQVATGILTVNVATASPSWRTLTGVGTTDTVTKGSLLYAKSNAPLSLRVTFDDGAGGNIVSIIPIGGGPLIIPCDVSKFIKLLEVQGSGQLIYFVCGNQ